MDEDRFKKAARNFYLLYTAVHRHTPFVNNKERLPEKLHLPLRIARTIFST